MTAWPEDTYLTLLGRACYATSSLEGFVLFDLPGIGTRDDVPTFPSRMQLEFLVGKTTNNIGRTLTACVPEFTSEPVRAWVEYAGAALSSVAETRNMILHARPITHEGKQVLYRYHQNREKALTTEVITPEFIGNFLDEVERHHRRLYELRCI